MNEIRDGVYLGNIRDAMEYEEDVEIVFSVTDYEPPQADIHIGLIDGRENKQTQMDEAIEKAVELLESSRTILVHCNAGASRSVTVLAAALAVHEGAYLEDTLYEIEQERTSANPNPHLKEQAYESIDQTPPFDQYE